MSCVIVTLFLDKDTWADLSLELEERILTKRPGDDIRLPKAKKQRLGIVQASTVLWLLNLIISFQMLKIASNISPLTEEQGRSSYCFGMW